MLDKQSLADTSTRRKNMRFNAVETARQMQALRAGKIVINSVDSGGFQKAVLINYPSVARRDQSITRALGHQRS